MTIYVPKLRRSKLHVVYVHIKNGPNISDNILQCNGLYSRQKFSMRLNCEGFIFVLLEYQQMLALAT